jgi:hypothetical protein
LNPINKTEKPHIFYFLFQISKIEFCAILHIKEKKEIDAPELMSTPPRHEKEKKKINRCTELMSTPPTGMNAKSMNQPSEHIT